MKDFRILLHKNCLSATKNRIIERITIGNYELSIQASEIHYCTPRKVLENVFDYEDMEVAIFEENGRWCNLEEDDFFNDWKDRDIFLEQYDGMVGGHIPIQIIQSLCDYIERKQGVM